MMFTGLCFISYEGKWHAKRPTNTFKRALLDSEKAFLGQIVFAINVDKSVFELTVKRDGLLILKTSCAIGIEIKSLRMEENAFDLVIPGDLISKRISFSDQAAVGGFQNGLKLVIHMRSVQSVKYGEITEKEKNLYKIAVTEIEGRVKNNNESREGLVSVCSPKLSNKNDSNQKCREKIEKLSDKFKALQNKNDPSQAQTKKSSCTNFYCKCKHCLLKKQEATISLEEEINEKIADEIKKVEESAKKDAAEEIANVNYLYEAKIVENQNLEEELAKINCLHREEIKDEHKKFEDEIAKVKEFYEKQISNLQEKVENQKILFNNQLSEKQQTIEHLIEEIEIRDQQIIVYPKIEVFKPPRHQYSQVVYTTRTGTKYHTSKTCRGLAPAHEIFERDPTNVADKTLCAWCEKRNNGY